MEYGGVAEFLAAKGFTPDEKNARACRVELLAEGALGEPARPRAITSIQSGMSHRRATFARGKEVIR
jgi:hypothetical protein